MKQITMYSGTIKGTLIYVSLHKIVGRIATILVDSEHAKAAKIVGSYFTSKPDCQISVSADITVTDGQVSFNVDLADLIKALRNLKQWIPYCMSYIGWCHMLRDNAIVKVHSTGLECIEHYQSEVVTTDASEVELFKALGTLEDATLELSSSKTQIML